LDAAEKLRPRYTFKSCHEAEEGNPETKTA
jgi:hypothetical protein